MYGMRPEAIETRIKNEGDITESRARLIARTEVARSNSILVQARAESLGSKAYIWQTAEDARVRESHMEMNGKVCYWDNPPMLSDGTQTHPGQIFNCRCIALPLLSDEELQNALEKNPEQVEQTTRGRRMGYFIPKSTFADEDKWITLQNGEHVLLGEGGGIKGGMGGKFNGKTLREIGISESETAPYDGEVERKRIAEKKARGELKVSRQKQDKHVEGTKEYERYVAKMAAEGKGKKPSKLTADPQKLIEKYAGTHIININSSGEQSERCTASEPVGKRWFFDHWTETKSFKIVYAQKGVHIFPTFGGDD
jgi:SPP1 gp7 family putative phage head morphogenesis protein